MSSSNCPNETSLNFNDVCVFLFSGQVQCTSYFIEPVQWMEPALLGVMDGQVFDVTTGQ